MFTGSEIQAATELQPGSITFPGVHLKDEILKIIFFPGRLEATVAELLQQT